MTPYIVGSNALQMEKAMGYDPVNFKRIKLDQSNCQVRVMQDYQRNALFEVICNGTVVMAFQFLQLRPWELNQKRDAFSRLFHAEKSETNVVYFSVLPTQSVTTLHYYPVRSIHSAMGETGFWACDSLRLSVTSTPQKNTMISITKEDGSAIGFFEISGHDSDDPEVLDAAVDLRNTLAAKYPIRIESLWEHEKLVWFHPSMNR